jgi:radical SAM protein with 4Fe4S-binding SPASM domain
MVKANAINEALNKSVEKCLKKCFSTDFKQSHSPISFHSILKSYTGTNYICYFPYAVFWKITSKCNLRCKHCFYYKHQSKFDDKNDLSTEEILKLTDFLIEELNIIHFIITGGEPFLQRDILQILRYLKSKNVSIEIKTNGTLITESVANELKEILNPKTDFIQISIDGATKGTNNKIRGEGSFQKCITGIKNLVKIGINTIITYTATSLNLEDIPKLYNLCKKLQVKQIRIARFKVCSRDQEYLVPQHEKVFITISNLIEQMENYKSISLDLRILKIYDFLNYELAKDLLDKYLPEKDAPKNLMCHNHDRITISGDGNIYLCPDTEQDGLCLGNLREKSFYEIWGNRFSNVFFQERRLDKNVCQKCKYVSYCCAGCPAKAYYKYGSISAPDSDCKYGRLLIKEKRQVNRNYVR